MPRKSTRKSSVQKYHSLPKHLKRKVNPERYYMDHPFRDSSVWKIMAVVISLVGLFISSIGLMTDYGRESWWSTIGLILFVLFVIEVFAVLVIGVSKFFGAMGDTVEELEDAGVFKEIARNYQKKKSGDKWDIL